MISGLYLGEIVRLALSSLVRNGSLLRASSSSEFATFNKFETKYVSDIERG